MMMRRRRRRSARWNFADSETLELQPNNATPNSTAWTWLLPPARVAFLLGNSGRGNSLLYVGSHLWLDFFWKLEGSAAVGLPDIDFGVIKTTISDPIAGAPDLSLVQAQWDEPPTPAGITSWNEDDDSGVDSWLWQHHIKGSTPPNAIVDSQGGVAGNQYSQVSGGSTDTPLVICRKFHVTQEWQPDVVVRSKRRLQKDEGILLYMTGVTGAGMFATCNTRSRTLTK